MPILFPPTNPSRNTDPVEPAEESSFPGRSAAKVRTGRWGELEEHELIHLLDALDDERARAQFRESVYISTIICLAIAWFLFYGPHILLHQPYYKDPIAVMKEHDQAVMLTAPTPPARRVAPKIDRKTMQQLQKEARQAPRPAPPAPQAPAPQQQEMAHNNIPPVAQPALPTPVAPKPAANIPEAPVPSAPQPRIAQNSESPGRALRDALRGGLQGPGLPPSLGSSGPLQAGAQILSDTQGVDFSAYLRRIVSDTRKNWEPLIPEEVQAPLMKKGIVGIRFTILPDGQIGNMILETRSGDVALDKAAWNAITSEGQFPPLPTQFHGPQLELRFGFYYNEPVPQ